MPDHCSRMGDNHHNINQWVKNMSLLGKLLLFTVFMGICKILTYVLMDHRLCVHSGIAISDRNVRPRVGFYGHPGFLDDTKSSDLTGNFCHMTHMT